MTRRQSYCLALALLSAGAFAQAPLPRNQAEVDFLVREEAGTGDAATRTQLLIDWMTVNLEWVATDYEQRTPLQILARGEGSCAELASVLEVLLKSAGIRHRWMMEINIQPVSDERQRNAVDLMKKRGNSASVFGRRHNDHRWLEIYDPLYGGWMPADPSSGVVGAAPWIKTRLFFEDRSPHVSRVVTEYMKDMLVPIAVMSERNASGAWEDRSEHYLLNEFDIMYSRVLHTLPSWPKWQAAVRRFAPLARGAFDGKVNLHEHAALIDELASIYEALHREVAELKP